MIALYVLLAAAAPGVVTPEAPATPVPELVRDVLSDRRFQFCHDPHYPLTQDEEALCHLGAAPTKTCPAFAEACRRGVTAHQTDTVTQRSWNLPGLGFLKPVGLVLVVGLLVLLGRALLSNFRLGAFRASAPPPASRPPPPAPVAAAPPESDADRLLARAEAAAAAGDHARAVVDLHGSLLRRLEAGGVIAFHPSRTNGEYVRAAGRVRPALVGPLRGFVHDVEAVQFGATAPGPEIYRSLLARLHQLTTATLLVMMMFVVGCGQRVDWDGSPSGRAAVLALLGRTGKQAHERLKPLTQLRTDGSDAVVLLPRAEVSEADWKVLSGFVSEGGLLVLAGLPVGAPAWLGVKVVPVSDDGPVVTRGNDDRLLLSLPPSPHLELESGFECALERARSSYAAVRERGEGEVMAFADDHLFMNGSLLFADNALALVRFFRGYQRIEFVGEETGLVSPDPVTSVTRGRLMPFLAQLGLVIAAFFLMRGIPFGRLREPPGSARRSFAEHTAALAQQYHLARAAPYLTGSYARFAAERLRQRMVLPASTALPVLAEVVARRAGRAPAEVLALLGEASDPNPQAALARLRGLGTLLDQMGGPGERRRLS